MNAVPERFRPVTVRSVRGRRGRLGVTLSVYKHVGVLNTTATRALGDADYLAIFHDPETREIAISASAQGLRRYRSPGESRIRFSNCALLALGIQPGAHLTGRAEDGYLVFPLPAESEVAE